jgi:SRSO17 transposase
MVEAGRARENLDALMAGLACCFARVEPRWQARKYVTALLGDLPRKNCWTIAERAGDATPDRMQRLLERACWDHEAAMSVVRDFVAGHLGSAGAVVVIDESGQEKKGERTAGVKRQYVGCAGRIANAINVVYCSYAVPAGHALVAARLYIPREWAGDRQRRHAAGVPDEVEFKTKPQLAVEMLTGLTGAGGCPPWCAGDEVDGRDTKLRAFLEGQGIGYVLGVPCSFRITVPSGRKIGVAHAAALVPARAWITASCGKGSKGDRDYAWAWLATASPRHTMLARRNLHDPSADLAFFYCHVPECLPACFTTLVQVAGRRWPVEEDFQVGKGCFGLDHSQVRTYTAICRHLVLSMAALAVCAVTAASARERTTALPPPASPHDQPPAGPGLIPLTVAEVRRLFCLLTRVFQDARHHLRWSWWRRRHQARARWYHQRARLQRQAAGP